MFHLKSVLETTCNTGNPLRMQLLGEDLDRRSPARTDRREWGGKPEPSIMRCCLCLGGQDSDQKRWQEFAQGLEGRNELKQQG